MNIDRIIPPSMRVDLERWLIEPLTDLLNSVLWITMLGCIANLKVFLLTAIVFIPLVYMSLSGLISVVTIMAVVITLLLRGVMILLGEGMRLILEMKRFPKKAMSRLTKKWI